MPSPSTRRDFLKYAAAAGFVCGAGLLGAPASAGAATVKTINLEQCRSLSPQDMAAVSDTVTAAWQDLRDAANSIRDAGLRASVIAILDNPAPTLAAGLDQRAAAEALIDAGLRQAKVDAPLLPPLATTDRAPQPFSSAPGSGWNSHHAYPGGLVTHVAFNVRATRALGEDYARIFGMQPDMDVALAAQLLHDLHKPWVFQWQTDGTCRTEQPLAATGEHHVLSVAESIKRKLPAEVVVAQACAHTHPGTDKDEAQVVSWITAAALLAGVDPVRADLLAPGGKSLPLPRRAEGFLVHLGDHDFVLSVPAAQWLTPVLRDVARERYGLSGTDLDGAPFNQLRNYVYSQASIMRLYGVLVTEGPKGVARVTESIVRRA